ncbi:MAG: NAD(P)/FAD-dependent oxidoreductase [Chitinivibrionales bacterium]
MPNIIEKRHYRTIIIGSGQAGLATAYHLSRLHEEYILLDSNARIGDSWRTRWDSLRLFTPSQHDGLPGLPFPAARNTFPTKDEIADYLEKYVKEFSLPVMQDIQVSRLAKSPEGFEVSTTNGNLKSDRVVVATGTNQQPRIPAFARELDQKIHQIHSSQYKNPKALPEGNTLVVGAGTSGVEIAVELSASRHTCIAGRLTPHIPDAIFRYAGEAYWWFASNVLTVGTPIGRKVKPKLLTSGAPLIRISGKDLDKSKVERVSRVTGVKDGLPLLQDGRVLSVSTVVWATGYKPDFSWIDMKVTDESGWPVSKRGVCENTKGLHFIGMPFQFGLTSGLVGGVGRDARFVAEHIHKIRN